MAKKFEFFYKTLWKKKNEPYGQLNREEERETQRERERDEVREVERGRKGEESTAAGKVEGRKETQLSPDCSPPAVKGLTPFNEGGGGGVWRAETDVSLACVLPWDRDTARDTARAKDPAETILFPQTSPSNRAAPGYRPGCTPSPRAHRHRKEIWTCHLASPCPGSPPGTQKNRILTLCM